jgi:hypothetical protein
MVVFSTYLLTATLATRGKQASTFPVKFQIQKPLKKSSPRVERIAVTNKPSPNVMGDGTGEGSF